MTRSTLTLVEAEELVCAALTRSRTSAENARSVARALVEAEAIGQEGHGLRRVPTYAAQAASGKIDGHAVVTLSHPAPAVLAIDAGHGFAYPALDRATAELPELARSQGIALAAIRRSHHCGALGLVVEKLAQTGLVSLAFTNTPGAIAPWGGRRALFGTNPIAFAAPVPDEEPIVVDLSLSKVARGKIMAAKQRGEPIPDDWAYDREGRPTTDPAAGLAGTMAPLGDAKGTALALMVELLAAGLVGANYAYEAASFFEAEGPAPSVGQLLIAIDPVRVGGEATLARFAELASAVENDEARLPGRRRQGLRRRAQTDGISIDTGVIATIEAVGR